MTDHNKTLTIIILAAGKGARMQSNMPKVMHQVAGRQIISWVLESAEALNPDQIITVIGPDMPDLESEVQDHTIAIQKERLGTADAVKAALPYIKSKQGRVLILLGDEPFVSGDALREMAANEQPSIMVFNSDNPTGMGRIIQNSDKTLQKIIEEKDADDHTREITLCNAGNFCLPYEQLVKWLPQISNGNSQQEYYLTDLPVIAAKDNMYFDVIEVDAEQGWGINDRTQLAVHESYMQDILRVEAMQGGVTMMDPLTTYLSWDTEFGQDVVIEPNVFFGTGVRVGNGTVIKTGTRLEGVVIGRRCEIGPFASITYPKQPTQLGDDVVIGNFVEVKRSSIADGVKAKHHAYIADAEIGEKTNIACGVVIVNYDGYQKHKTIIGENVMVGSNASLIAPIKIGDNAFIAAGSTISDDVPKGALGIERSKPAVIENWIEGYRKTRRKK